MAPKAKKAAAGKAAPAAKKEAPAPKEAEAQKRKAEEAPAAEAPASKEPKVEAPVEQEQDAKADKRPTIKEEVAFNAADVTLNCVPMLGGRVLGALSDAGMSSLLAGARCTVGAKAGRYMFEVKVLELAQQGGKGAQGPRPALRVGVSAAGASPVLAQEFEDQAFFDVDGGYYAGGKRAGNGKRVAHREVVAVVLNLDQSSPNKNTLSLFHNGVRACEPQALPENLHGKELFPHLTFRGMKVQLNWGPEAMKPLPFSCTPIGRAAAADVTQVKADAQDGKFEVVLPVGFPGEGTFDWLDSWLQKNPKYTELSDRKIVEWARLSGVGSAKGWRASMDRSDLKFGVQGKGDDSAAAVNRILRSVAALVPRNYVVMEVKENLVADDRAGILRTFHQPCYKKVAHVVMGEPTPDFKQKQQAEILKDKQDKSDRKWRAEKAEKKRKKEAEKRRKQLAEEQAKRKAEAEAKRKAAAEKVAAAKKAKEEAEKKAKDGEKKEDDKMEVDEGKKEEEKKEEEKKEEEKQEEKKEEEKKEEQAPEPESEEETEPPKVELTDEEKNQWFAQKQLPDVTQGVLNRWFAKFSIPEKAEGFDDVRFEWQKAEGSKAYLQKWVREKKKVTKVEDLKIGQWFRDTTKAFKEKFAAWQAKQKEYKASAAGKADEAKKKKGEEGETTADGDFASITDVADVGSGEPLFKDFALEDWALFSLRFELCAMQDAFKKDVDDEDRPGIPEAHVAFYYQRYFNKQFNFKAYGVANFQELVKLCKDTITLEGELLGKAEVEADDFAALLKHTELHRRERERRLAAGDETARLKVTAEALKAGTPVKPAGKGHGKSK